LRKIVLLVIVLAMTAASTGAATSPKIPIILDTDIGTDIDDAFALALIIDSPELELLGITTVSGDTQGRARLAAKMLWEAGGKWRQVPVAAGEPGLTQPIDQARWAAGFTSPALRPERAVDFLKAEFDRRPGEITLVAIGELTNAAALLKRDPLVARKIKRIVMMGGAVTRGYAEGSRPDPEWNIKSNVAAAQAVFNSGVPILMVPLDVTAMLGLDDAGRRRIFTHLSPLTNALTLLYHLWNHPTPVLFDPMAVAMLIEPSLCETKPLAIEVDAKGYTRTREGQPPNATAALQTDPARFFDFYLKRVAP
jgi:purine nucleosidase